MPRYSHAYDFAFEVTSETEDGSDVTPAMLRAALIDRAARIPDTEIPEACGRYDTHELDGTEPNQPTPITDELRIVLGAAEHWIDAEADEDHPDPIGDASELIREANELFNRIFPDPKDA